MTCMKKGLQITLRGGQGLYLYAEVIFSNRKWPYQNFSTRTILTIHWGNYHNHELHIGDTDFYWNLYRMELKCSIQYVRKCWGQLGAITVTTFLTKQFCVHKGKLRISVRCYRMIICWCSYVLIMSLFFFSFLRFAVCYYNLCSGRSPLYSLYLFQAFGVRWGILFTHH